MINSIRNIPRRSTLVLFLVLMIVGAGCKSQKKALALSNAAAEKARLEQEATARKQQEEEQKRKEADERARNEAEAREREKAAAAVVAPAAKLEQYFNAIANSGSVSSANGSISEALSLFASEETPVLIVISQSGGQKDYDRPTTIKAYLNYLKDQKKNVNRVSNLEFDSSGKIKEVELVK